MSRPAARDQPDQDEIDRLLADLRASVETAQARPAAAPRFTARGGQLTSPDGARFVVIDIGQPNTDLVVADHTLLEIDAWTEPTDLLLHRLQASGVDYDAVVDVGH